jgi:hypothetical protein
MMTPNCPRCGSDAAVTGITAPGGGTLYTCWYTHGEDGHLSWQVAKAGITISSDGVTADLTDPFEQIVRGLPHALIEYGVLEYRLRLEYPQLFASHVAARGHYLIAGGHATASSVRFAAALLRLGRAGILSYQMRPATGAWSYNDKISYWALNPPPPADAILTWTDYCTQLARDPEWTDKDRATVAAMAATATPAH